MLDRAAEILIGKGVLIYPTETLYAIGCDAFSRAAAHRVAQSKGRGEDKPFPVVIGGREQLDRIAQEPDWVSHLLDVFWPGPLSVLLPARRNLPAGLASREGLVSVRWSPHPVVRDLCLRSGLVLVATSANRSGQPAVVKAEDLDPGLVREVDLVLEGEIGSLAGVPSSVVLPLSPARLRLEREGAISAGQLQEAGWEVVSG